MYSNSLEFLMVSLLVSSPGIQCIRLFMSISSEKLLKVIDFSVLRLFASPLQPRPENVFFFQKDI